MRTLLLALVVLCCSCKEDAPAPDIAAAELVADAPTVAPPADVTAAQPADDATAVAVAADATPAD